MGSTCCFINNQDYHALVWYLTMNVPIIQGSAVSTRFTIGTTITLPSRGQQVKFTFETETLTFQYEYDVATKENNNSLSIAPTVNERIELSVNIRDGIPLLKRFLDHVRKEQESHDAKDRWCQTMHKISNDMGIIEWTKQFTHSTKSFDTIILDVDVKTELVDDIKAFLDGEKWYQSMGIPYKRGYLLHGPPGTGKSSIVLAIANMAKYNIYHLNLSMITSDAMLNDAFVRMPHKCVVVFEDIDCMSDITHTRHGQEQRKSKLQAQTAANTKQPLEDEKKTFTLSALLNHIDGFGATHGRIIIMTTNHTDVLDAALIRPGRADMHIRLGMCSRQQIRLFFELFFPGSDIPEALHTLPDNTLSPAEISCAMLQFRNRPLRLMERLAALVAERQS